MLAPQYDKGGEIVKRYLALLLLVVMAVSIVSAAGVIQTQRAEAKPKLGTKIVLGPPGGVLRVVSGRK